MLPPGTSFFVRLGIRLAVAASLCFAVITFATSAASAQTAIEGDCTQDAATIAALQAATSIELTILCVDGYAIGLDFEPGVLAELPAEATQLTKLIELDVSNLKLRSLPPEVGNLTELVTLKASNNSLTTLPKEIGKLTKLETLSVFSNELTAVPAEIGNLTRLKFLVLSFNNLTQIPDEVFNLTALFGLNISFNDIGELSPKIGNLTGLNELFMNGNKRITELPAEIGKLTNLRLLGSASTGLTKLPPEIGNLAGLFSLELTANSLSELPPTIGNLSQLLSLELGENELTTLPPEIGTLFQLIRLDLNNNPITSLPADVGELTALEDFNMSGTPLVDTLPFEAVSSCASGSPTVMVIVPAPSGGFDPGLVPPPEITVDGTRIDPLTIYLTNVSFVDDVHIWSTTAPNVGTGPNYEVAVEGIAETVTCPGVQPELTMASSCLAGNGRVDFMLVNQDSRSRYRIEFPGLTARERTVEQTEAWRMPFTGRSDGIYDVTIIKTRLSDNSKTTIKRSAFVDCESGAYTGLSPEVQIVSYCVGGNGFIRYQFVNPTAASRSYIVKFAGLPNRSTTAGPHAASVSGVSGRPDGTYLTTIEYSDQRNVPVYTQSVTVACD